MLLLHIAEYVLLSSIIIIIYIYYIYYYILHYIHILYIVTQKVVE